jgi:hypothetical protein
MAYEDNSIDIDHLKTVTLNNGDLQDIVVVLDTVAAGLVLPQQTIDALDRLRKLVEGTRP